MHALRSRFRAAPLALAAIASSISLACDGDAPPTDAGSDAGPPPTCDTPEPFDRGDADGDADPLAVPAGSARAGRIEAGELPEDRTGLARWAAGDFVLANERVAVLIEDTGASDLYDPYGGRVVGVASREADGTLVAADFNEILLGLGANLVATEHVGVIADGSDGGAAIVRATGPLAAIDFAGDLLSTLVPGDFSGWPAAIDYRLEPGSDRVDITLHAIEAGASARRVPFVLQAFFQGSRMPMWSPSAGFSGWTGAVDFVAFDDPTHGAAYAWAPPEGQALRFLLEQSGVLVTHVGPRNVAACEHVEVPLGSIVIGRTLDRAQASVRRSLGETTRTITGHVLEADGSDARGVRLHVTRGEAHVTRAWVEEGAAVAIEVPEGALEVWAYREGWPVVGPVAVGASEGSFEITMGARATIEVEARDATAGTPVPARVQVLPVSGDPARAPDAWGEPSITSGRTRVDFAGADGLASIEVPPGEWRVVVSRGYEYELVDVTVDVAAGATERVTADLLRSVDTSGVLCADYHIHTTRSPDSDDDARDKVRSLVADGLELPVRSDHEFIAAFDPVVRALGLDAFAQGLSGEELTTFEYGHFGVFPAEPDDARPNGGAPRWPGRLPPELFGEARALAGSPSVIVNHPRSGGSLMGYFNAVGYDPDTGMVTRPEMWDDELSIVEVFNDSSFEQNRDGTVVDWFSMLAHGRRVFAVGSSDTHHIASSPVGYPRTCLELGEDDPRAVTPAQVRDATAAGRSYVSGGIYLDVEAAGGAGPGGAVSGAGARAQIHVVVRAATWIDVQRLEVLVDGASVETIPIRPEDTDPLDATIRLDATVEVDVAGGTGSFVVLVASGDETLEPVHRGRTPFAVTNPIFFTR